MSRKITIIGAGSVGSTIAYSLSQEELARRIGASRQTVNMIERGDYNPSLHLCISICQTLGKTLDELFWPEHETSQEK